MTSPALLEDFDGGAFGIGEGETVEDGVEEVSGGLPERGGGGGDNGEEPAAVLEQDQAGAHHGITGAVGGLRFGGGAGPEVGGADVADVVALRPRESCERGGGGDAGDQRAGGDREEHFCIAGREEAEGAH